MLAARGAGLGQTGLDGAAPLIASTPAMHTLRQRTERVALTDFTVLIEGESGRGLVARQVHELSRRYSRSPFQIVDDNPCRRSCILGSRKTAGKDAAAGKPTYPPIYGVDRSRRVARECLGSR